jgi:hypothetical protein
VDTHTDTQTDGRNLRNTPLRDGFRRHEIHIKFYKDWFRHSKLDRGDSQTQRAYGDSISLFYFSD